MKFEISRIKLVKNSYGQNDLVISQVKVMDNKTKLSKIAKWQNNDNWHELTCGNDSQHLPLVGKEVNGNVILVCLECDYDQDYIPEVVFK